MSTNATNWVGNHDYETTTTRLSEEEQTAGKYNAVVNPSRNY